MTSSRPSSGNPGGVHLSNSLPDELTDPGLIDDNIPTVLTKLQKWGDYDNMGGEVRPTRFLPMKTPISDALVKEWARTTPNHMHTVMSMLTEQATQGRHVGLILDLSNHECLYSSDLPPGLAYTHINLVAKEIPGQECVTRVIREANEFWERNPGKHIAIHCTYGFNRTGFVVCCYLIQHLGLSVDEALARFAEARPPGVKHEVFREELKRRYPQPPLQKAISFRPSSAPQATAGSGDPSMTAGPLGGEEGRAGAGAGGEGRDREGQPGEPSAPASSSPHVDSRYPRASMPVPASCRGPDTGWPAGLEARAGAAALDALHGLGTRDVPNESFGEFGDEERSQLAAWDALARRGREGQGAPARPDSSTAATGIPSTSWLQMVSNASSSHLGGGAGAVGASTTEDRPKELQAGGSGSFPAEEGAPSVGRDAPGIAGASCANCSGSCAGPGAGPGGAWGAEGPGLAAGGDHDHDHDSFGMVTGTQLLRALRAEQAQAAAAHSSSNLARTGETT